MKFSPSHHLTTIQHMAHSKNCENFALISVRTTTLMSCGSRCDQWHLHCSWLHVYIRLLTMDKRKKGEKKVRKEIAWENLQRLLKLPTDLNEMLRKTEMRKLRKTQKQFSFRVWVSLWEDHASVERTRWKSEKIINIFHTTFPFLFLSTTDKPCKCDENSSLAPILCKMCVRD